MRRPTPGLCSVDESVSALGRFQPRAARSSHGLWSSSRFFGLRSCRVGTRTSVRPTASCPAWPPAARAVASHHPLGRWNPFGGSPGRLLAEASGCRANQSSRSRPASRLFSEQAGLCSATRRGHLRAGDDRRAGASEVCPEAEVRIRRIRDAPGRGRSTVRCRLRPLAPRGLMPTFMRFLTSKNALEGAPSLVIRLDY
jgi:hypothetical protein